MRIYVKHTHTRRHELYIEYKRYITCTTNTVTISHTATATAIIPAAAAAATAPMLATTTTATKKVATTITIIIFMESERKMIMDAAIQSGKYTCRFKCTQQFLEWLFYWLFCLIFSYYTHLCSWTFISLYFISLARSLHSFLSAIYFLIVTLDNDFSKFSWWYFFIKKISCRKKIQSTFLWLESNFFFFHNNRKPSPLNSISFAHKTKIGQTNSFISILFWNC